MAVRSLSARLCRHCRRTEAQLTQRRFTSTALGPGDDEAVLLQEQQQEATEAATPVASTSRAGAEAAHLISSLRFEINQAQPVVQTVWARLHELYETSPSALVQEDGLLQSMIPILSQHTPPPPSARGLSKIIAVQEEAEAIYARYRFLSNRMKESAGTNRHTVQQENEILLTWLRSIEALGYGPAAWRIWSDHRKAIENHKDLDKTTRHIAHSVLVSTMKWLVLQRDRNVATGNFSAHADTCLRITDEMIGFLQEHNMYNWIARSLRVRILKEAEKKKEMFKLLKDEFGFDPAFPSLVPFDVNSGVASLPSAKKMDPHVINTVMYQLAKEDELSKMISLFETAIGTSPRSSKPLNESLNVPFFSSSSLFAQGQAADSASQDSSTSEDRTPRQSVFEQRLKTTQLEDKAAPALLTSAFSKPVELSNVNMQTLELLVSEAVRLGRIHLAHHYVKQAHAIWRQERTRLRQALEKLASWAGNVSNMSQEELMALVPPKIIGPRISLSTHAIYPIYMQLKHSKNQKQRYAPVLASCMRIAQRTVNLLEDDTAFFARAYDNLARIKDALSPESLNTLEAKHKQRPGFETFDSNFDLTKHLLLQTRLKVDLGELARHIEVACMDTLADRQADSILNSLSVQRAGLAAASQHEVLSMLIRRLRSGIRKAENWLLDDAAKDSQRVRLLRDTLQLSANQLQSRIKRKMSKFARRRAIMAEAIMAANAAVKEAIAERRELEEAEQAAARAKVEAEASTAAQASSAKAESDEAYEHSGELRVLNASSKTESENELSIHASPHPGSPGLVLC